MKRVIAFIYCFAGGSLLLFTLSLLGCSKNDFYFMYSGMKSEIIRYDTFANEPISANDTCSFSTHRIRLLLRARILSTVSLQGIGNRLYAWQPDIPYYENVERVEDVRIIPLYNYTGAYPSGSDLSGQCLYAAAGYGAPSFSKEELIAELNGDAGSGLMLPEVSLEIKVGPARTSVQQFVIELETLQHTLLRDTTIAFVMSL